MVEETVLRLFNCNDDDSMMVIIVMVKIMIYSLEGGGGEHIRHTHIKSMSSSFIAHSVISISVTIDGWEK